MNTHGGWRRQQTTVIDLILACILLVLILQIWLLTASLDAYLGGNHGIALPAFLASLACLALNVYLVRYVFKIDRTPQ